MKTLLWALGLAFAAALAAYLHDPQLVRRLGQRVPAASTLLPTSDAVGGEAHGSRMRKCVAGSAVVYTDGDCPAGSQAQGMSGGTVSVLPAQPVTTPGNSDASARSPHARDLLVKPEEASIKDQRMDAVIGK